MVLLQDTALPSLYLIFGQSTHLQQHVMEYFKYLAPTQSTASLSLLLIIMVIFTDSFG